MGGQRVPQGMTEGKLYHTYVSACHNETVFYNESGWRTASFITTHPASRGLSYPVGEQDY